MYYELTCTVANAGHGDVTLALDVKRFTQFFALLLAGAEHSHVMRVRVIATNDHRYNTTLKQQTMSDQFDQQLRRSSTSATPSNNIVQQAVCCQLNLHQLHKQNCIYSTCAPTPVIKSYNEAVTIRCGTDHFTDLLAIKLAVIVHSYEIAVLGYGLVQVKEEQRALAVVLRRLRLLLRLRRRLLCEELHETRLALLVALWLHDRAVDAVGDHLRQTLVLWRGGGDTSLPRQRSQKDT